MTSSCEYDESLQMFAGSIPLVMGTKLEWLCTGLSRDAACDLWDKVCFRVEDLDRTLNRFDPRSEVSRWNSGERFRFGSDLRAICEDARHWWEETDGLFDITLGHMDSWPEAEFLDFGGIAKGWFLHEAGDRLRSFGAENALVSFGGSSILAIGTHPSATDGWKIGLPHPVTGQNIDEFCLKDCALSVSGNTPRYGGHIVDPNSGHRITGHKMVSVQGPDALAAEILSTAAMIASERGSLDALKTKFKNYTIKIYG